MKPEKMSEAEREVMQLIWASNGPVTSNEILENLRPERSLKKTTVLTFLARLTEKGLVKVAKKGRTNHYTALVGEKEYKKTQSKDFLFKVHDGSIKSFVAALCDDSDISREEIEELKKWLMQR